ncbi:MAG TPA: ribonuclease G, partial [Myxococcales bacterium]
MSNILVINASGQETRVALIEQGTISEYYLERKNEKGIVGNIYKGKVVRVLPGMQAAFVDIGLDKAAFLYVGDIVSDPSFPGFSEEMDIKAGSVEGDPLEADDLPEPLEESVPQAVDTPLPAAVEAGATAEAGIESAAAQGPAEQAAPAAEAPRQELAPPESAAGAPGAEPAEIVELHPDDALEDEEGDDEDDEEEELDEADVAHAAAEEVLAAEQAQTDSPGPAEGA